MLILQPYYAFNFSALNNQKQKEILYPFSMSKKSSLDEAYVAKKGIGKMVQMPIVKEERERRGGWAVLSVKTSGPTGYITCLPSPMWTLPVGNMGVELLKQSGRLLEEAIQLF